MKKKNKDLNGPVLLEGHKPRTRRDFLAQGFLAMGAYAIAPSIFNVLQAQTIPGLDNCAPAMPNPQNMKTPVIIFDLAGGCNFAGSNVMVGGAGGQMDFLQSYTTLGLPPDFHPSLAGQVNNELGLAFHSDSGFIRGIQAQTDATIRSKVDGGIFCTSSADDTGNNPHNPMYWLNRAGARGALAQLAGTRNSESGGKSIVPPASLDPSIQPVTLNRPQDALSLVNVGRLNEIFNEAKAQQVMQAIERLSESKIKRLAEQSLPMQIKTLVQCGYIQSKDLLNQFSADALDASQDPMVAQAFGNLNDGNLRKTATIAKMVLDGHIGAGTIEKGGYDYHSGDRARGETRDLEAGELIGRVLQLAALKQKNVMIYVLTDGGVSAKAELDNSQAGRGKYAWTGDSGQRSSAFMLVYRHAGRPTLRNNRRQIGHFKESGGVENSATVISNNVINLAKAVVANYLALHGEEGQLANVVGDNPFGANLNDYLLFNPI